MAEATDKNLIIDIVTRYVETVGKEIKINKVILYGSYARGNQHKDSDIDVAVVSSDLSGDRFEDQLKLMRYRRKIDLRIEPMPFRPEDFIKDNPFAREIMETGIEILP